MIFKKINFKKIKRNNIDIFFDFIENVEVQKRGFVSHEIYAYVDDRYDIETKKPLKIGFIRICYLDKNIYENLYNDKEIGNILYASNFMGLTLGLKDKTNKNDYYTKEILKSVSFSYWSSKNYNKANFLNEEINQIKNKNEIKKRLIELNKLIGMEKKLKEKRKSDEILIDSPFVDYVKGIEKEFIFDNTYDIRCDLKDFYKNGIAIELYINAIKICFFNKKELRRGLTNENSQKIWDKYLSKNKNLKYRKNKDNNEYVTMKKPKNLKKIR